MTNEGGRSLRRPGGLRPPHWALRAYAEVLHLQRARNHRDPGATQAALLRRILREYAGTELGGALRLADVRDVATFRSLVPVTDSAFYAPFLERVLATNEVGIVSPTPLSFVARSSGTTEANKHIACPTPLLRTFKRFELAFAFGYMRQTDDYSLLDGHFLVTAGSPSCEVAPSGITVGLSSGIMTKRAPRIARRLVRPSPDILAMTDWNAKVAATAREALDLDVRVFSGIPMWATTVLEGVLEHARAVGRNVENVSELWPNLRMYFYSGTSLGSHEARLRRLLGPRVHFQEIYSATESPVAFQSAPDDPRLEVDLGASFFELQEAGSADTSPRIGVEDARIGVPYRLLVTTTGGLFAYRLGDVIEIVARDPLRLKVVGREKEEMNLAGEKVTFAQWSEAMASAAARSGAMLRDYFVVPAEPGDEPRYEVCIDCEREPDSVDGFARALDDALGQGNGLYRDVRAGRMIGPPIVTVLPPRSIDSYTRARTFGQSKVVHLHNGRTILDAVRAMG